MPTPHHKNRPLSRTKISQDPIYARGFIPRPSSDAYARHTVLSGHLDDQVTMIEQKGVRHGCEPTIGLGSRAHRLAQRARSQPKFERQTKPEHLGRRRADRRSAHRSPRLGLTRSD